MRESVCKRECGRDSVGERVWEGESVCVEGGGRRVSGEGGGRVSGGGGRVSGEGG